MVHQCSPSYGEMKQFWLAIKLWELFSPRRRTATCLPSSLVPSRRKTVRVAKGPGPDCSINLLSGDQVSQQHPLHQKVEKSAFTKKPGTHWTFATTICHVICSFPVFNPLVALLPDRRTCRKTAELKFRTPDGASVGMKLNGIEYKGHKAREIAGRPSRESGWVSNIFCLQIWEDLSERECCVLYRMFWAGHSEETRRLHKASWWPGDFCFHNPPSIRISILYFFLMTHNCLKRLFFKVLFVFPVLHPPKWEVLAHVGTQPKSFYPRTLLWELISTKCRELMKRHRLGFGGEANWNQSGPWPRWLAELQTPEGCLWHRNGCRVMGMGLCYGNV